MRVNQRGFSIVAALALAAVIATGAMFLGKILSYLTATRMRTQARISSLGYEDSMAVVVAEGLRTIVSGGNCGMITAANLDAQALQIPGTSVGLLFSNFNTNHAQANLSNTISFTIRTNPPGGGGGNAKSEKFIDNPSTVLFRIDFLNKNAAQDEKVFASSITCEQFWGIAGVPGTVPTENRQMKVSYQISWRFRDRDIVTTGSKLINLSELGF